MGYSPRKLFEIQILFRFNRTSDNCSPIPAVRKYGPKNPLPPPLPPPLLDSDQKHLFAAGMSVMIIILLLGIVCVIVRKYYWGRNDYRSRRNSPTFLNTRVNFGDVDQGPGLDHHPMWHINTVGFPQAMIDKITIVKFKKGEGLIEGTECSVCLSEFEEDESLRLLPKCNHAFHVPCIDTWLLSHKNCPLCRVPAISDDMFRSNLDLNSYIELRIENTMENFESDRQERNNSNAEERGSEIGRVTNVHGDNGNDNRDQPMNEDDEQSMRRSISFDSLSASMIDNDGKIQEGNLELNNVGSPSTNKLKRSSSMEHKGTITAMRRSFSSFRQNRRR